MSPEPAFMSYGRALGEVKLATARIVRLLEQRVEQLVASPTEEKAVAALHEALSLVEAEKVWSEAEDAELQRAAVEVEELAT